MASADEVNSTLKNLVSNVGLLVNSTAVTNSLTAINTTLNAISTALTTAHVFGGSFALGTGQAATTVPEPKVLSNSAITFAPSNADAGDSLGGSAPYISAITPGVGFSLTLDIGSAIAPLTFYYVGYNP